MTLNFKRVPAIEKCFSILSLLAEEKRSLSYSEIARNLDLNKSTVFNILHTLNELDLLEKDYNGQFRLGPSLFILGNAAAGGSELIQAVHPHLEAINNRFKLSAFLGVLAGHEVIIVDKADQANPIKISSEIGMKITVDAGVAGKALLAQLPPDKIDAILSRITLKQYTKNTIVDKTAYKQEIMKIKESGIAYDQDEYIEGLAAVAVSFNTYRKELQTVIWAVGLKQEFKAEIMKEISLFLLDIKEQLNQRFSMIAGPPSKMTRELN